MALLSKDQILNADDLPTEKVEVPEWGGSVLVRGLTGTERDSFEMKMAVGRKEGSDEDVDFRAPLIGRCLVDEEGKRLFTNKEVSRLGKKSGRALDRIFDKVRELSGMDDDATEEAAEGFGDAPSEGSTSD